MIDVVDVDKTILVEYVNRIIREAIKHGGDLGGPYFSNEEGLVEEMLKFGRWAGLSGYGIFDDSDVPQFGKTIAACVTKK